jgi:gentisate 1,2-dioxygenase
LASSIGEIDVFRHLEPNATRLVRDWLRIAVESGTTQETLPVAEALWACRDELAWQEPYTQYGGDLGGLSSVLAFADLVGPGGPGVSRAIWVGLSLQAPRSFYPPHVHTATEVYLVLSGTAGWQRKGGDWVSRPPGTVIIHRGGEAHAMATTDDPLLTVFAWTTDLAAPVSFVGET